MKDYYCLDISFPGINFNDFYVKRENIKEPLHAHLFSRENEIELRIFYDPETNFGEKLCMWSTRIHWSKFGTYLKVEGEVKNEKMQRLDLSDAGLLGTHLGSNLYEGSAKYVVLKIDCVKFYWSPSSEEIGTADFYLSDSGFKVVKGFYTTLYGWDGEFDIRRMNDRDVFYSLGKSQFRPEFDFSYSDSRDNKQVVITKEPKIKFKFNEIITDDECIFYGKLISLLASFYFHFKIQYVTMRINSKDHTLVIRKIFKEVPNEHRGGFYGFGSKLNFHDLLQSDWQEKAILNFKKLEKTIELFNQAMIVDRNSEFLIRYNIIEICNSGKCPDVGKFQETLNAGQRKVKYTDALNSLLETIHKDNHKLFTDKWQTLSGKLKLKPMLSPLTAFFESQNLKPNEFPISADEIKKMRDNIVHGSIEKIDEDRLRKINKLLYRINGILILNLLGISDWKLDMELN